MDQYVMPATQFAKAGVKTQLDGLERIQSRERKTVVKDYIAPLIDAQRAVVLVAKAYQDLRTRVKRADCKTGDWDLCGWQGQVVGKTRPKSCSRAGERPFKICSEGGHKMADGDVARPDRLSRS